MMNAKQQPSIGRALSGFVLALFVGMPGVTTAAPGALAQIPLFLAQNITPNVFFVLDDSGSMDWEILKTAGAISAHPATTACRPSGGSWTTASCPSWGTSGWDFTTFYPQSGNLGSPSVDRDDELLELCPGYSVLAYDPSVIYTPWVGTDSASNSYTDRTLTTACADPYNPPCNVNLSNWVYFLWTDGDSDGDYDVGECPRPYAPAISGSGITPAVCATTTGCVAASSATAPSGISGSVNFANWYSYYRKREYVLKQAVAGVVSTATQRMGFASLHDNAGTSTAVRDMSDTSTTSVCGATVTNKECLLDRIHQVNSTGSTPLRRALDEAGHYYDSDDGGVYHEYLGSTEASPILPLAEGGNCQQNFSIVVSDGFWNGTFPATDSAGQTLTTRGNADSDGLLAGTATASTFDQGSHADGGTDTLADVAMHYYEKDLSTLNNDVNPIPGIDENQQQHMVTFTVAFGVDGTLSANPPNRADAFAWPLASSGSSTTIDDMRHAAWNGRGQFLSARNPNAVSQALADAIANIAQRRATLSAVSFNTTTLTAGTLLFQATADASDWSGGLLAFNTQDYLTDLADNGSIDTTLPDWDAASVLDGFTDLEIASRLVLTRGASVDGVVASTWASLSAAQQADLRTNSTGTQDAVAVGQARLAYLLGDRSCEVLGAGTCATDINGDGSVDSADKSLRERGSRLGDILNSEPIVAGIPRLDWPSTAPFPTAAGTTYTEFKQGLTSSPRTEVVYVGANDGMLHGFRTNNGREVLAYMPSSLTSGAANEGFHRLSDPQYSHRYYVDSTPAISDAYVANAAAGAASWRTLAVGGLGAGGRGLYALDITNPTNFTAANAADILLWEFTDSDDSELGYTLSEPIVAMMNNGEWAVIVGSGYNDAGLDPDAHLFVLFIEGGLDGSWTLGTDYVRIEAPDATATIANRNGLSSPAVADLNGDGTADRAYAGDLFGNMWAFDLSNANPANWAIASGEDTSGTATTGPLFTGEVTTAGVANRQPITAKPVIAKHPSQLDTGTNQPNTMVYFGTGQYLVDSDPANLNPQSFYGIWDNGTLDLARADLQQQTFDANFANNEVLSANPVDWTSDYGWYIDLPDSGERVVVTPDLRGTIVFFNSTIPATGSCAGGGSGFQYSVDIETGGRPDFSTFDYNNNGVVDVGDLVSPTSGTGDEEVSRISFSGELPSSSTYLSDKEYTAGSDGSVRVREVFPLETMDTGRLSWQELNPF